MATPIIKLDNVDFYYDKGLPAEVHALDHVSLEVQQGEYISFFGPSGCGKSTLLYIISGVERPESGIVLVNNQDLLHLSQKETAIYRQIGIGIVFQNFNLIPSIKNLDNITLPMAFLGISPSKRRKRGLEIFERLGITELADRYPHELSGGQQQRIGIARALANDAPIILADEPIGNLDSKNAVNVLNLLKEFNEKDGKTIILVTHEAWSLRDVTRVFHMRDGKVRKIENRKPSLVKRVGTGLYYRKLFPGLPTDEAHARSLSTLILRGYSSAAVKRLEYFIIQRFSKKMDEATFEKNLDKPFKKGGVGLWKQKAKKISDYITSIMGGRSDLDGIYKKLEKTPDHPLAAEIEKMRVWLIEGFKVSLTPIQIERLNELVGERIRNIITPVNFRKTLDLSKIKGGVGLRSETSFKMADKLETILGRDSLASKAKT